MKTFPNCMKIHVKILPKPSQQLPKTFQDPAQSLPGGILGEGPEFPSKCIDFHVHFDSPGLANPSKTPPKCSPNPSKTLPWRGPERAFPLLALYLIFGVDF